MEVSTDVCMTEGMHYTRSHTNVSKFFNFQLTISQLITLSNAETLQGYLSKGVLSSAGIRF